MASDNVDILSLPSFVAVQRTSGGVTVSHIVGTGCSFGGNLVHPLVLAPRVFKVTLECLDNKTHVHVAAHPRVYGVACTCCCTLFNVYVCVQVMHAPNGIYCKVPYHKYCSTDP